MKVNIFYSNPAKGTFTLECQRVVFHEDPTNGRLLIDLIGMKKAESRLEREAYDEMDAGDLEFGEGLCIYDVLAEDIESID